MTILVLGGYGFLGSHVVAQLREIGVEPKIASRRTGVDILDFDSFCNFIENCRPSKILNCAAHVGSVQYAIKNPAIMLSDNIMIINNLYNAVYKSSPNSTIINPISNCSYPGNADVHLESDYWDGAVHESVAAYGNPRRLFYTYANAFYNQFGLKTINWIIANAYGPGDYTDPNKVHALNGIIIRMILAKRKGDKKFEIWGSGRPTREWVYIKDAARMLVQSSDIEKQLDQINLAQNKAFSIAEIAAIAAQELEYDVEFYFNTQYQDGAPTKILDDQKFRSKYPEFKFTPLIEGIRETIKYYNEVL